ncbi:Protein CP12, regulation of Calvin cycle via association/dissociation of PRK/CP12/GAPDH complex [uncultured Synechococcales cyanobacterium]|uniref:Protein CP12, regulation of Calvin cycle via association/dissociation of PRK/CP12/GAPDH complex n=1 Tax=uncultured Synechococcales cyanobacterium TaxID=1936017 RepID=A0A6J4VS36_9CYAN|nr:Protein CP12, regulation of Calvin cycle via association/dissociation of PRK/CP12/GAPDH complex [uncultured Synechococcales cyanobacterium]
MSNIHEQVEQELQKAADNLPVPEQLSDHVQQEIKKAASNIANSIDELIEKEREQARAACATSGGDSTECAVAWDVVEELQAEAAHQKTSTRAKPKNSLEKYCDENPSADECRIYDD